MNDPDVGTSARISSDSMEWRFRGDCNLVVDPDLFYEDGAARQEIAKDVCAGCPVLVQCKDFADDPVNGPIVRHGIWGGQTAKERGWLPM